MNLLKWILIAALPLALTGCPDRFNDDTNPTEKTEKYSGTWVRAADYCDYQHFGSRVISPSCEDIIWENNSSVAATEDAWLMISISREGGINSFLLSSSETSNGNWGLGFITAEGFYVGYLTTMNNARGSKTSIQVLVDGDSLTLFSNSGSYTNRVAFLKVNPDDARNFNHAYENCARGGYCKGENSSNQELRKARRDRNNDEKDSEKLGKFDQKKYDECIADGISADICARG